MKITHPKFDQAELEKIKECLESGWVTQGPLTAEFETLVAKEHQLQYALATTSCTAALHLAVLALGIGPGDEVIVPAFTWVTTAHAVEYVGAKVVFVDIDKNSFNIDPKAIEAAVTPYTKAIIAVHLFGLAAAMKEIITIAKKYQLSIIEDAACAIGTYYFDQPVGGLADVGCFSFHPRKIITTGEGGMLTTNQIELAERVKSLRNHGSTGLASPSLEKQGPWTMGTFNILGFNLRMSDIQAAIGIAQMAKLKTLLSERRLAAERYSVLLSDIDEIKTPQQGTNTQGHSFQSYVTLLIKGDRTKRNQIMTLLEEHHIQTRPGTHAVHRLGYYRNKYNIDPDLYPIAAKSEDCSVTLPIFPGITEKNQKYIIELIKNALCKKSALKIKQD